MLVNQSPHQLDLLQWFMGDDRGGQRLLGQPEPPRRSRSRTPPSPSLRFRSGGLGSIVTSLSQKPGIYTKVHVHGSNGASVGVETDRGATFIAGVSAIAEPPLNDLWTIPGEEHLLAEFQAEDRARFAADRRHDPLPRPADPRLPPGRSSRAGRPLVTGEDGREVVAMFTAIYRSQRDRRPIAFPLSSDELQISNLKFRIRDPG